MNSYGFADSVKVEKANALARYRRFNNIARLLKLIEVFVAVALISWSSTRLPTIFKVSGEYLFAVSSYVLNQHVVFLVGNVIVLLCYVLSGHAEIGNESGGSEISDNSKFRSVNHCKTSVSAINVELEPLAVEESPSMKQTSGAEIEDKIVRYENEIVKTESQVMAETAIKKAAKQIEKFQRTQSEKLKREISMKPRRELRRSVTERRRSKVITAGDGDGYSPASSFETVEKLSNEEFRLAVEAFISKQQSFLKQQSVVEKSYYQ